MIPQKFLLPQKVVIIYLKKTGVPSTTTQDYIIKFKEAVRKLQKS